MTDEQAQKIILTALKIAMKRGYKPYPINKNQRYDNIGYRHGSVEVYIGTKYSHSRNRSVAQIVDFKDIMFNHDFARYFTGDMAIGLLFLNKLVCQPTYEERLKYIETLNTP